MLAWNLYWDARSPVADTLAQLDRMELTECEASDLATKLRALAEKAAEIEVREIEQRTQEAKNAGATARNRTR